MSTPSSFVKRLLRASLTLPQGTFPGTSSNTLVLENYRMSAKLSGAGNFTSQCSMQIFGMRQVDMNAVTVLFGQDGNPININARAILTLEANDAGNWLQVFQGQFVEAQPDYKSLPDVSLSLTAVTGLGQQMLSAAPSSFSGATDVVTLCQKLATQMGYAFENNGVTGTLNTPYLSGTLMDQFREVCQAAGIDYYFDSKSTLIITPRNQPRQGKQAVVISATSGLVGYVSLNRFGIELDCLWNAAIELGSPIQIQNSDVPGTDGQWFPYKFEHTLESIKPGGRWFSHLECMRYPASSEGT